MLQGVFQYQCVFPAWLLPLVVVRGWWEQGWIWVQGVSPVCRMVTNSCIQCSSSFHNFHSRWSSSCAFQGDRTQALFCSVNDSNVNYPCSTRPRVGGFITFLWPWINVWPSCKVPHSLCPWAVTSLVLFIPKASMGTSEVSFWRNPGGKAAQSRHCSQRQDRLSLGSWFWCWTVCSWLKSFFLELCLLSSPCRWCFSHIPRSDTSNSIRKYSSKTINAPVGEFEAG